MRLFDLTEKVAIVTGGNGGIGLGMAEGLADAGASIVLTGRNQEKAGAALKSLEKHGRTAHFVRADVTRAVECRTVVAEAVERFGRLDIWSTTPAPPSARCLRIIPRRSGIRCWTQT